MKFSRVIFLILINILFSLNIVFGQKKVLNNTYFAKFRTQEGNFGVVKSPKNNLWGLKNKKKPKRTKFEYDAICYMYIENQERYLVRKEGLWGVIDENNSIIIPIQHKHFALSSDQKCYVADINNKWGAYDGNLKPFIPFDYDDIGITRKLFLLKKENKWEACDENLNLITASKFDNIKKGPSRFLVKRTNKYGIYNDSFQMLIPIEYDMIEYLKVSYLKKSRLGVSFSDYYLLKKNGKFGIADGDGIIEQEPIYDKAIFLDHRGKDKFYLLQKNNKSGLCKLGDKGLVIECEYEEVKPIILNNKTHFLLKKEGLYGIVNVDGTPFYDFEFNAVKGDELSTKFSSNPDFVKNLAFVKKEGKWGILDGNKDLVAPIIYDSLYRDLFFICVTKNNKQGGLTLTGTKILETTYDSLVYKAKSQYYPQNLIFVKKGNQYGYAKLNGEFLVPPKYEILKGYSEGFARVQKNKKWGFVDINGIEIIAPIYDFVKPFNFGVARVQLKNETFFINKSGKRVEKK